MKKKITALIVMLVVLGGGIAALLLLNNQDEITTESSSSTVEETYLLGGMPQPFVQSLRIQNELDDFTVVNGSDNAIQQANADTPVFHIEGIDDSDLNMAFLKGTMTTAGSLTAKSLVAENASDLAKYGLDSPRATIEATYDEGSGKILIGDDTPSSEGTYVLKDGSVYLVTTSRLNNFLLSKLGFVNKAITDGDPSQSAFSAVTLSGRKFPEPIVMERAKEQNEELNSAVGMSTYSIISPIQTGVDITKGLTPLSGLFGLTATNVTATTDDPDALTAHGLADPWLITDVKTDDPELGNFTLSISEVDTDNNVYIRRNDRPFIYQVPVDLIAWYSLELFDYQEKMLILPFIDDIAGVDVTINGEVHTFVTEGEGDDLTVTLNGETIDTKNYRQFYQSMISANYDSLVETGPETEAPAEESSETEPPSEAPESQPEDEAVSEAAPEGEASQMGEAATVIGDPVLQYTYRYRDGRSADVVTFYPGTARRYIIRLNDGPLYYTTSLYVDRILEDLPKLAAGEDVKSFL